MASGDQHELLRRLWPDRQSDAERTPLPRLAGGRHRTAVEFNNLLDNCQSQARTAGSRTLRLISSIKTFENVRQFFWVDTNSLIRD